MLCLCTPTTGVCVDNELVEKKSPQTLLEVHIPQWDLGLPGI